MHRSDHPRLYKAAFPATLVLLLLSGCDKNYYTTVAPEPPPPLTPTQLSRSQDAPGIVIAIQSVTGASTDSFRSGDHLTVNFTVKKHDGTSWQIGEFTSNGIFISGPTFNYQRVIPQKSDVTTRTVTNEDGSFSYTFADALPDVYAAPLNDSDSFGPLDGELKGQPLLAGTYTVGMYLGWNYTVDGDSFRDGGDGTADFLFGGATDIVPRAAVGQDNCNQCHSSLRAHGGTRRSVTLCLLCHTSGAEDENDPKKAGGTPGVSIDFRVMIHKIHAGANLPSVLGVGTDSNGARNYAQPPQPYVVGGDDFSAVRFPVFPNLSVAMPRDFGYSVLSSANRALEDQIRTGPADCTACHGDPDGTGPVTAPAQGGIAYAQPTRRACGSCHDDWDPSLPYTSNQQMMPIQQNDSSCILCHRSGNGLDPEVAHVHPLKDPAFNPGFKVDFTAVAEAGIHNSNGRIDPGEKIAATFRLLDGAGNTVAPAAVASMSFVIAGPTSNNNILLSGSLPLAALTGNQPFTVPLPETVLLEYVGTATAPGGDIFTTDRAPHWQVAGALTSVWVRTATSGGNTTLAAATTSPSNYVDVVSSTGFAHDDYIVLDDGVASSVEYLRVQTVQGNRLWFGSSNGTAYAPGPRNPHLLGATVKRVVLTPKTLNTDYSLNAQSGTITELLEFGAGNAVIATYTADFVMPATYPLALNDAPDLGETSGRWAGKPIVDGTYAVTLWGQQNLSLTAFGETNSYRATAPGARFEFLVGAATELEPYALIDSSANCYSCHKEIGFHGYGRVGFGTCIACHGTAGFGDRPQYVAPNAPATTGTAVSFRSLLHKIHMGRDLTNAATYQVVGFGSAAYPDNFGISTYEKVGFPALPRGVQNCTKCHGAANEAWLLPQPRNHPTAQVLPVRVWAAVCGSCHDSAAAASHISINTSTIGTESCEICHGSDRDQRVDLMHKPR